MANPASQEELDRTTQAMTPLYFAKPDRIATHGQALIETPLSFAAWRGADQRMPDVLDRLGEIKVPTLILVGSEDFICSPTQAERLHKGVVGSHLVVIDDAGHFPFLEQPMAFFKAIDDYFDGHAGLGG
jgi:proline iminopeptidase